MKIGHIKATVEMFEDVINENLLSLMYDKIQPILIEQDRHNHHTLSIYGISEEFDEIEEINLKDFLTYRIGKENINLYELGVCSSMSEGDEKPKYDFIITKPIPEDFNRI